MAKTVISLAKELIASIGKEEAIKVFEKKIVDLGEPKNFEDMCVISGYEIAIAYIKDEIGDIIKD